MSKTSQSYSAKLANWKLSIAGYDKHKTEIGFADAESKRLKELAVLYESLEVKQEQLKADLQKTTSEIVDIVSEADKLSAAIHRYAKAKFGPNSPEIKDFK
jgi:hypothetical protein